MYNRIGEAEDYDSNFGDTQESNSRYKTITIKSSKVFKCTWNLPKTQISC